MSFLSSKSRSMYFSTNALNCFSEKSKTIFLGGDHSISYSLGRAFFDYCSKNKEKGRIYNEVMREYSHDYSSYIELFSFPKINIIMDVGGGTGQLLTKILEKNGQIE